MNPRFEKKKPQAGELRADGFTRVHSAHARSRTILLISIDTRFHENLRRLANNAGILVVKAGHAEGMIAVLQVVNPGAVLLDLDLPHETAWETADILLNEPACPAVILLTERTDQFEMRGAIAAGSLINKNDAPARLLEVIHEGLELPQPNQAQRNAAQRMLIRWLAPSAWPDSTPANRFWGLNGTTL